MPALPLAFARVPALLALVTACLLTGACGDDSPADVADQDPAPLDLRSAAVGADVKVVGMVSDVLSVNSFELTGALVDNQPLLVISPEAVPLGTGTSVIVEGTVEEFEDGDPSRFGLDGADVPPVEPGRRFVLADSVDAPVLEQDIG